MFSGSGACSSSAWRFSQSLTMRCERSAMSAIERPSSAGSGNLNPVVPVLVSSAIGVLSVGTTTSYTTARPEADSTMLSSGSGGQPKVAGGRVQAGCGRVSGTSGLRYRRLAPLAALSLAGCASFPSSMNPVSWWHDLQGGKIAEERPPPPGADQPYPNLASVPPKPEQPDRAALANIASALIADRTNAQHLAAAAPIPDPSLPSASPALFGRGTVPPPTPAAPPGTAPASATMSAAEAPPAPAATNRSTTTVPEAAPAPAKAPVASVQSAPLAPPGATAQPPAAEAAPPPALPAGPPALPNLPPAGTAATEPTRQLAASAAQPAAAPADNRGGDPVDAVNNRGRHRQRDVRHRLHGAARFRGRQLEAARGEAGERHHCSHRLRRRRIE